jgi:hypothetical protein
MGKKSYIHLDRGAVLEKILGNPDLSHTDARLLMYCIIKANFTTSEARKGAIVYRGSFVCSTDEIMKSVNIKDWRTFDNSRKKLKELGYINYFTEFKGTHFHVKNYENYVRPTLHKPPVTLQVEDGVSTCNFTEPISIYPVRNASSSQDIKKESSMELRNPADSINTTNIVSLNGKQINKDSDYFKQLDLMYGEYTDTWGFLIRTFKWVKDKNLKINDVEKFVESLLRKEKDRVVNKMFISEGFNNELQ